MLNTHIHHVKVLLLLMILLISFRTQAATEIHKSILHHTNDSSYLILHLFNFHATGGSYEKGNLRTTGYNNSEIRVINLTSKKTIAFEKYTEYNFEGAFEVLGVIDDLIWIYSMENKSGLHALSLKTLKKEVSQANIYSRMQKWTGSFIEPEWNEINKYYGCNNYNSNIIITTYNGKTFNVNALTYEVSETKKTSLSNNKSTEYLTKSIYDRKDTLDIYDEYVQINNSKSLNTQFQDGSFVIDHNSKRNYKALQLQLSTNKKERQLASDELSLIRAKKNSVLYASLLAKIEWLNQEFTRINKNLNSLISNEKTSKFLLKTSNKSFFISSRANKLETSPIAISHISRSDTNLSIEWTLAIDNMYYNVSKAQNSNEFKRFFREFVPDARFFQIEYYNNKLLVIYLMQLCIIDIPSGEISWKQRI